MQIATGRKTATIGVVGLRTDGRVLRFLRSGRALTQKGTSSDMWTKSKDNSYKNISIFKEIGQYVFVKPRGLDGSNNFHRARMPDLRELQSLIKPSNTDNGDGMRYMSIPFLSHKIC